MNHVPQPRPTHGIRRWVGIPLALAALALTAPSSAQAAPASFAQFTQSVSGAPFNFSNNTSNATIGLSNFSTSTPVNFNFLSGPDTSTHLATLSVTAVTTAAATSTPIAGKSFIDQSINGGGSPSSDVLKIVDNATGKILLSLTFTGDILGFQSNSTGQISGSTARGNTVTYSSDYGNFGTGTNTYSLGLTSINPVLSIGPGGFLNSFTSSINGSFRGSFQPVGAVPEPASVAMFGSGILATALLASQRKRLALLRQS